MKGLWRSTLMALALTTSCSKQLSAREARQKADEFVAAQYSVTDLRLINVETAEKPRSWVVTYSAKGEATGGPLVVGVDKKTGGAHLIEGYQ